MLEPQRQGIVLYERLEETTLRHWTQTMFGILKTLLAN
jgi:hypothetical protein